MPAIGWALVAVVAMVLAFLAAAGTLRRSKFVKAMCGVLWPFFVVMGVIAGWNFYGATHGFYVVGWLLAGYSLVILIGPFAFHMGSPGAEEQV